LKDKSSEVGMPEENLKSTECRHSPARAISDLRNFKKAKKEKKIEIRAEFFCLWGLKRNQRHVAGEYCWAIT